MTNKINGIDVSECEFYEEMRELPDNLNGGYYIQHCYCGLQGDNYCICNKNPNCYFKQLKHLQQELDIKEKMLDKFMIGSGETLEKLQKENEELKTYIQKMDKPEIKTIDSEIALKNIELRQENEELKSLLDFEIQKREVFADKSIKYEFALEEIRNEIGDLKNINRLINLQKILDTINEVLNDRD